MSDSDDPAAQRLPAAAQRTLDQIAGALGVTTALLHGNADGVTPRAGEAPGLAETSALLQAYVQIGDREARQRCLDFVQVAAQQR
ncbi:hypothetical protein AEGHOMDF_2045 [Methylobacterium soli]|nr:hypothetical protein AEGHOMDF_2045 [Methylobacterium soli]